jgi:hypothetical protein
MRIRGLHLEVTDHKNAHHEEIINILKKYYKDQHIGFVDNMVYMNSDSLSYFTYVQCEWYENVKNFLEDQLIRKKVKAKWTISKNTLDIIPSPYDLEAMS